MRMVDLIIKKRDHVELSTEEIKFFVEAYTRDEVPDYQAASFAMAILLNGMSPRETTDLSLAMAHSGDVLDLSDVCDVVVDKHSTGGVGDKTTLVVEPVVAACGLPVGKMSGRGLGFSGGTLDKMESIPGFRTDLTTEELIAQLRDVGVVLTGQTGSLAPADGKMYALRDVTGTVPSLPLIASSIMSKKIAAGAERVVLDVKVGVGAFMTTLEDARELAETMVKIAALADRKAVALLSDMNQPLGVAVGNALEVKEAIDTLRGGGPDDFREHSYEVAVHMLILGEVAASEPEARDMIEKVIWSGEAWEKFRTLVKAQGGDVAYIDDPTLLPQATLIETVTAPQDGFVAGIDARIVGETAVVLGAGRATKADLIDHAVGIEIHTNVGDEVEAGSPLFTVHANDAGKLADAKEALLAAHTFSDEPVERIPLFYGIVKE